MKFPYAFAGSVIVLVATDVASAAIMITEIHYNPNGSEGAGQEWIEIYNSGGETEDLSGWDWGDRQDNSYSGAFAIGTTLAPGAAAVVVAQSPATFSDIWGKAVQVIQSAPGTSLANAATATNEEIVIRDAAGIVVDAVNYEVRTDTYATDWPASNNRSTIYLLPSAIDPLLNDLGSNWAQSADGVDGAFLAAKLNTDIANATLVDIGSPGFAAVPEPGCLSLAAAGGLLALRRRRA